MQAGQTQSTFNLLKSTSGEMQPDGRKLGPEDFQANVSGMEIKVGKMKFRYGDYLQVLGHAIGAAEGPAKRFMWMHAALTAARGAYTLFEEKVLINAGQDRKWAESVSRRKYNEVSGSRLIGGETVAMERLLVDTAAKAVHFSDEYFLAMAQEHCFELGGSLRYRSALASFLRPYDLNGERAEQLQERSSEAMDKRLGEILSANDPFLYTRSSVLDRASYRHMDKSGPMVANGKPLLPIDPLFREDSSGARGVDRPTSPWLPSIIGTPGARRSSFVAAEVCYELSEQAWADIAAQLDERTAGELKAYLAGRLSPAEVGMKNYMHFRRQIDGQAPSKLRWLILEQRNNGAVTENRIYPSPCGIATTVEVSPHRWEHRYRGEDLDLYRGLFLESLPVRNGSQKTSKKTVNRAGFDPL